MRAELFDIAHPAFTAAESSRQLLVAQLLTGQHGIKCHSTVLQLLAEARGPTIVPPARKPRPRRVPCLPELMVPTVRRVGTDEIKRLVSARFGVALIEMVSDRRARKVARPRQVAMYLAKRFTRNSLPEIGRHFGDRDHTTVMHAIKVIAKLRADDADLDEQIAWIEAELIA